LRAATILWHSTLDNSRLVRFPLPDFDAPIERMNAEQLAKAKSLGFSDRQIAHLTGTTEDAVRAERKRIGLVPSYCLADTRPRGSKPTGVVIFRPAAALHPAE
jgi:hypothetical protein